MTTYYVWRRSDGYVSFSTYMPDDCIQLGEYRDWNEARERIIQENRNRIVQEHQ